MPRLLVLVGRQAHWQCSRGCAGRWQLSSLPAPTFCPGLSRLHLLYTQPTAHHATSLFVCRSKGLRYLQPMLLCHHMLTFATQLVHVHSLRKQGKAESQASPSRRQLSAAIMPKVYLCDSEIIISLNLPYLTVIRDPKTKVAQVLLYKQSHK